VQVVNHLLRNDLKEFLSEMNHCFPQELSLQMIECCTERLLLTYCCAANETNLVGVGEKRGWDIFTVYLKT